MHFYIVQTYPANDGDDDDDDDVDNDDDGDDMMMMSMNWDYYIVRTYPVKTQTQAKTLEVDGEVYYDIWKYTFLSKALTEYRAVINYRTVVYMECNHLYMP